MLGCQFRFALAEIDALDFIVTQSFQGRDA